MDPHQLLKFLTEALGVLSEVTGLIGRLIDQLPGDPAALARARKQLEEHTLGLHGAVAAAESHPNAIRGEPKAMAVNLQPLIDEITAADTEIDGAIAFINGVPALVNAAVTQAMANGATAAELQPVVDLGVTLQTKADALKAAIQQNTPSGGP